MLIRGKNDAAKREAEGQTQLQVWGVHLLGIPVPVSGRHTGGGPDNFDS
jgi:hypothetical protein